MDLISRETAVEIVKKLLYETAFNSCGHHQDDEIYSEIAENRIGVWLGLVPSAPAVPLDKLAAMLSTIGADINCYYCRAILGECTKPPEEREYECDSMAHWAAFLNNWRKKMEEQDEQKEANH